MKQIDWSALAAVHRLALDASVSWALHYDESVDRWYFSVSSAAPAETFEGDGTIFECAVADALTHLRALREAAG